MGGWRTTPQTLARRLGCQAIGGPLAQGLAYDGCHYQSLDSTAPGGGPGSGHARHPHHPQEAHRGHQAHRPAARLSAFAGSADRPDVHLPPHLRARPAARSPGSSGRGRARTPSWRSSARSPTRSQWASRTPPGCATTRSTAMAARPRGRTTATTSPAQLRPAGAQAHDPGRWQAHRAGPLHRRRGRTGRVRPTRGWRGPGDRPSRNPGRARLPRGARPADQGRARRPRARLRGRGAAEGAPPLASCPVDRYLDAVA